jgi:hypothetical protein
MIDKMVAIGLVSGKSATSIEALHLLLKRPWDPVLSTYNQQKPVSQVFTVLETFNHIHHYIIFQFRPLSNYCYTINMYLYTTHLTYNLDHSQ